VSEVSNLENLGQSCFGRVEAVIDSAVICVAGLGTVGAEALATLLPVLQCGEESASLVFDGLAMAPTVADRDQLRRIAEEERQHEHLLCQLAASLPIPLRQAPMRSTARRFYLRQQHRSIAVHFARIAALDSGACIILSALLRPEARFASAPAVQSLFKHIYRDESRHVRLSRHHAISRLESNVARDIAHETRNQLADVLLTVGDCFESLRVDAMVLDRHLRHVPQGLFA
jgi:hypothetical protein